MLKIIPLFCFAILSSVSHSADWGIELSSGIKSLADPNGDATANFFSVGVLSEFSLNKRDNSFIYGLSYLKGGADSTANAVGQNIEGFSIFGAYKLRFPITRKINEFYTAFGFSYSNLNHSGRHIQTSDGYLRAEYSGRQTNVFELLAQPSYKFNYLGINSEALITLSVSTEMKTTLSAGYRVLF